MRPFPITYADARNNQLLLTGDVLLCRPSTVEGRIITEVTQARYSHAAMIGWAAPDALMLGETRQRRDARLICLSAEIDRYPGFYDVYRLRRPPGRLERVLGRAWSFVCHATGSRYGWNYIARVWARRRLGRWIPPIPNSDDPQTPRDCSGLVHAALRNAGAAPLKAFDCDVVPNDLADARHFDYLCTLYASDEQVNEALAAQDGWTATKKEEGGRS